MNELERAREERRRSSSIAWSIRLIGGCVAAAAAAVALVPGTPTWIAASVAAAAALTAALLPPLIEFVESKRPPRDSPAAQKAAKRQVEKLIGRLQHANPRSRRQAAIELGKLGSAAAAALPDLIQALDDPDPHVRESVAQALEAGGSAAVRHLVVALRHQKGLAITGATPKLRRSVPRLREVIGEDDVRAALVDIGTAAAPALREALREAAPAPGALIAAALKTIESDDLNRVVTRALSDEDADVRLSGAIALAESASAEDVGALADLLRDSDPRVRVCAIAGLARVGTNEALEPLVDALNRDEDRRVRYEAVRAVRQIAERDPRAVAALVRALDDSSLLVELAAVIALGEIGLAASAAVPQLTDRLEHRDWTVRRHAAEALGKVGARDAVGALTDVLDDEHEAVRVAAAEAIERIRSL